jgi:hypothetical protein
MWWLTPIIPATQGAEIGRMEIQGQPQQKVSETSSQPKKKKKKKLVMVAHTCLFSYKKGVNRRIVVQAM